MKITNIKINNYRNIKNCDISLNKIVTIIGENDSGKSNLLKAITLPFTNEEIGFTSKTLLWTDINNDAKNKYYQFIIDNQKSILGGLDLIDLEEFQKMIPSVSVEITLQPDAGDEYCVKDLIYNKNDYNVIFYGILYEYKIMNIKELLIRVHEILKEHGELTLNSLNDIRINLLPIELYDDYLKVPYKNSDINYSTRRLFRYSSLAAERDEFSFTSKKLGSSSLVKLFKNKLSTQDLIKIEKQYSRFFEDIKNLSGMDKIINWQDSSNVEHDPNFFKRINILPNMPTMGSLLNSIKLGFDGEHLSYKGLGYRNLILLLVLINSLNDNGKNLAINILTLEEPEAHLCINNKLLIINFIDCFMKNNDSIQLFYSTHDVQFINKLNLTNIIIMSDGNALSFKDEFEDDELNYLTKNPNFDIYKLLFSNNCILVEGLTEELFIRTYLSVHSKMHNIEIISFHKGFTKIIDIWLKINATTARKLGIIRDYDNQDKSKQKHHAYNIHTNIHVSTTSQYTLETEVLNIKYNAEKILEFAKNKFGMNIKDESDLLNLWIENKSNFMLELCDAIINNKIVIELPNHIKEILNFMGI